MSCYLALRRFFSLLFLSLVTVTVQVEMVLDGGHAG